MIILDKVNKYFNKGRKNEVHVIDNTTLTLGDTGLVALLGPSGCGKTTLLNTIGGLDRIKRGKIIIDGKKISSRSYRKVDKIRNLNIGYIFQDYKLIDNLSVYDNVALVLKMIGIKDKKEIKKRVEYVLDKTGMLRYKRRPASMLSGGERQRVGIARAIVKDPSIILADEPTGNLDSKNSLEIMKIIASISKERLVILVTHEQDLAHFYASRIIEISDGKIIRDYENDIEDALDYKMDNSFYLKDFKNNSKLKENNVDIDVYSDSFKELKLDIVLKNGNIYIKSNTSDKIEIVDESSSIEFIDDNYKKIEKKDIDTYKFKFNDIINKNIKKKYSSILNPITLLINGFKKVFDYTFLKKILLIGFLVSGSFIMFATSRICSTFRVPDEDFVKYNKNYLLVEKKKIKVEDYLNYESLDYVNYILPGSSIVKFNLSLDDYYQSINNKENLTGSITSIDTISKEDLILGVMPENSSQIVVDKLTIENMLKRSELLTMIGINDYTKLLNRIVNIPNVGNFEIVGITNFKSPSIYVNKDFIINIIYNNKDSNEYSVEESELTGIQDYNLFKDKIELKEGRYPENNYETIVNISNKESMKLNKEISEKVNDTKLTVVGYYYSKDNLDMYLVNNNTIKYNLITKTSNMVLYPKDKNETINKFREFNLNIKDSYESSKAEYKRALADNNKSVIVVSSIMILISLIEMFLMSRSSFLSRIKEIGIYRAIGVKRIDIYKMFYGEIFAITTLASLPGIIFMAYCLSLVTKIKYLKGMFVINPLVVIIAIVFVYLFNLIIGLIPVFNVIRKTPAQILSRTDAE